MSYLWKIIDYHQVLGFNMGRDWEAAKARAERGERNSHSRRTRRDLSKSKGTMGSTSFLDKPQRADPSVTNTFFNSGAGDSDNHGHVKYRTKPDGTIEYLYARDVEGNEYDVWIKSWAMTLKWLT